MLYIASILDKITFPQIFSFIKSLEYYFPFIFSKPDDYISFYEIRNNKKTEKINVGVFDQFYEMYRPEAFILNCLYPASTQGIATLVQRDWRLVYFDGSTAVLIINRPDYESIFSLSHIQQSGLKKLEDHRRAFVEAPYQNGNPVTLIGAAKIYLALNRATEAESLFRLLLQEEYMMPGALIGLGNAQLIQGNFDEAFLTLQQAVETYPTRLACWLSYEMACRLTNNDEQQARANENIEVLTANYNEVAADKDN